MPTRPTVVFDREFASEVEATLRASGYRILEDRREAWRPDRPVFLAEAVADEGKCFRQAVVSYYDGEWDVYLCETRYGSIRESRRLVFVGVQEVAHVLRNPRLS